MDKERIDRILDDVEYNECVDGGHGCCMADEIRELIQAIDSAVEGRDKELRKTINEIKKRVHRFGRFNYWTMQEKVRAAENLMYGIEILATEALKNKEALKGGGE